MNNTVDIGGKRLTVNQAPAITSANHTTFTVGTAGSFTVKTTGFPTSSLNETGTLPGGVTFTDNHDGTATLSGTPAAGSGGTYNLTFTASNGVGSPATQNFTLVVSQAAHFAEQRLGHGDLRWNSDLDGDAHLIGYQPADRR